MPGVRCYLIWTFRLTTMFSQLFKVMMRYGRTFKLCLHFMYEFASTISKISASEIPRLFNVAFKNSLTTLVTALCMASGTMMDDCYNDVFRP